MVGGVEESFYVLYEGCVWEVLRTRFFDTKWDLLWVGGPKPADGIV